MSTQLTEDEKAAQADLEKYSVPDDSLPGENIEAYKIRKGREALITNNLKSNSNGKK